LLSQLERLSFQGLVVSRFPHFTRRTMTEETKSLNATHKPDHKADTSGVSESAATAPIELTAMVQTASEKSLFLTFSVG